jgi:NNP family nitrate/nitrite transporter-like MFS transporter
MIGGLGGFVLPIAFGVLNDLTGIWTSCFMLLFLIARARSSGCTRDPAHGAEAVGKALDALPSCPKCSRSTGPSRRARWRPS